MFTGIIQTLGTIQAHSRKGKGARLLVRTAFDDGRLVLGESIAVDGACLTVARILRTGFEADLSAETLSRTTAGSWKSGRRVNLERSMTVGARFGGHIVQGHVDGPGRVSSIRAGDGQSTLRVSFPAEMSPLIAEKGSIAVDGVSLTVCGLGGGWFEAALIPHTLRSTNLSDRRARDMVNLEIDLIARYIFRQLQTARIPTQR